VNAYVLELLSLIAIYTALTASLNLLAGYAGLVSVCHAAFFAVGAYTSAILSTRYGWSVGGGALVALIAAGALGFSVARLAGRLRDEYFLLVTFALQVVTSGVLLNWIELSRGAMGISNVPRLLSSAGNSAIALVATSGLMVFAARYLERLPFGHALLAIRDDQRFAASLGKNVPRVKALAASVSAGMAALAGSLYAHWMQFVSPESFKVDKSILILSMVILGGKNTAIGSLGGAATLLIIPEVARLVVGGPVAANLQGIFYGLVLVITLSLRPSVLWRARL